MLTNGPQERWKNDPRNIRSPAVDPFTFMLLALIKRIFDTIRAHTPTRRGK